ncbi:hypothetical protein [Endozoicomonas numazuensis]|nr:hypothetical protein [Endozoicomonas numazuensis]
MSKQILQNSVLWGMHNNKGQFRMGHEYYGYATVMGFRQRRDWKFYLQQTQIGDRPNQFKITGVKTL